MHDRVDLRTKSKHVFLSLTAKLMFLANIELEATGADDVGVGDDISLLVYQFNSVKTNMFDNTG